MCENTVIQLIFSSKFERTAFNKTYAQTKSDCYTVFAVVYLYYFYGLNNFINKRFVTIHIFHFEIKYS